MKNKVAFFDMDGTIVAPRFYSGDQFVPGFPSEVWKEFCNANTADTYMDCIPVSQVIRYAHKLTSAGWACVVLTVALSEGEEKAKIQWVQDNSEWDVFTGIYFVKNDDAKFEFICEYMNDHQMDTSDCLLVEDNYYNILRGIELGICTMHVSHIITGCYDAVKLEGSKTKSRMTLCQWYEFNKDYVKMVTAKVEIRKKTQERDELVAKMDQMYITDILDLFGELEMSRLDSLSAPINSTAPSFEITLIKR